MPPRTSVLFGIFALMSFTLRAQNPVAAARQWRIQHQSEILQAFSALLSVPNVAADPANLRRNADTLASLLRQRHFASRLLAVPGSPPVVFGERQTPSAKHTIVFYAHYDGQPVTPSEWRGSAPFVPALREVDGEQRIFARSAGDDKAAIYAQLVALDALQAAHIPLRANIRFVWEGEEEAGSPHLEQILNANRDLVHGDVWLVCDGPVDQSRQQTLVFGARGDAHLEITVYGANRGLHSGHYGNWAPNPAMMLVQLLAGMKDGQGRVLIPHFYQGIMPLGAVENKGLPGHL
jgi:acetylornithine deacetylase/succinyl-diaminopimelate desuccinylase-like protein